MKYFKKIASLALVFALALTLAVPAMAAANGSITVRNAVEGQTYTIYRIFDLESYSGNAYSYKVNDAWSGFFAEGEDGLNYVNINDQGYVTWKEGASAADFVAKAIAYAKDNSIVASADSIEATFTTVTFSGLPLGYYLVDSSLGALCALTTTKPNAEINEKNVEPTIEKKVQEDSDSSWGDQNTAEIGQIVNFKTTVHAKPGAVNYVVHDKMSDGLTFNNDVAIDGLTAGTDYNVVTEDLDDDCDFHIVFTKAYLDSITADTNIVITYSATLNEKAVISADANTNETKLDYSEEPGTDTEWDKTETFAFKFDLVKTDGQNKVLDGAKFELYDAKTGGNKIALVEEDNGTYRIATPAEKAAEGFTSAVIETVNGQAVIKGLDANTTYWLEETAAPAGYNKLAERVEVKIEAANLSATVDAGVWTTGGVHVVNNTGAELPSTGGIGTTVFYVLGGILVMGAGVLLVTKRRLGEN